jgi:hypothetical protein
LHRASRAQSVRHIACEPHIPGTGRGHLAAVGFAITSDGTIVGKLRLLQKPSVERPLAAFSIEASRSEMRPRHATT